MGALLYFLHGYGETDGNTMCNACEHSDRLFDVDCTIVLHFKLERIVLMIISISLQGKVHDNLILSRIN